MMMKYSLLKIWFLLTLGAVLAAALIRLIWEVVVNPSTGGMIITVLISLVILGGYALIGYFIFRPDPKKLTSLPVIIGVMLIGASAVIGSFIHFFRFYLSPQFGWPWSLVIALLYLFAVTSVNFLTLWIIWVYRKSRQTRR
ncbi:MAG: hypothetical protein V3R92_04615 [Dehalococcoidales bacterium]